MFKTKEEKLRQIPKYLFSNKNIKPRFTINQVVSYPVGSTIEKIIQISFRERLSLKKEQQNLIINTIETSNNR